MLPLGGKARYMESFHSRAQHSAGSLAASAPVTDSFEEEAASRSFLLAKAWRDKSAGTAEGKERMSPTTLQLLELLLPWPVEKGFSRTKWHHDGGACVLNDAAADGGESDHTGFITHACSGSMADTAAAFFAKVKHHVSLYTVTFANLL